MQTQTPLVVTAVSCPEQSANAWTCCGPDSECRGYTVMAERQLVDDFIHSMATDNSRRNI